MSRRGCRGLSARARTTRRSRRTSGTGGARRRQALSVLTRSSTSACWRCRASSAAMFVVGLVGDEALEAVTVEVGEGELRAGVWALAAADQPGALRARSRGRPGR